MKRALLFLALALAPPVSCNALQAAEKNEASDKGILTKPPLVSGGKSPRPRVSPVKLQAGDGEALLHNRAYYTLKEITKP